MMTVQAGLYIEGNAELAAELKSLILDILNTSAGDSVKEKALDILESAFPKPSPNNISNCYFTTEMAAEPDNNQDDEFEEEELN